MKVHKYPALVRPNRATCIYVAKAEDIEIALYAPITAYVGSDSSVDASNGISVPEGVTDILLGSDYVWLYHDGSTTLTFNVFVGREKKK
jgi:hypothetical protein